MFKSKKNIIILIAVMVILLIIIIITIIKLNETKKLPDEDIIDTPPTQVTQEITQSINEDTKETTEFKSSNYVGYLINSPDLEKYVNDNDTVLKVLDEYKAIRLKLYKMTMDWKYGVGCNLIYTDEYDSSIQYVYSNTDKGDVLKIQNGKVYLFNMNHLKWLLYDTDIPETSELIAYSNVTQLLDDVSKLSATVYSSQSSSEFTSGATSFYNYMNQQKPSITDAFLTCRVFDFGNNNIIAIIEQILKPETIFLSVDNGVSFMQTTVTQDEFNKIQCAIGNIIEPNRYVRDIDKQPTDEVTQSQETTTTTVITNTSSNTVESSDTEEITDTSENKKTVTIPSTSTDN